MLRALAIAIAAGLTLFAGAASPVSISLTGQVTGGPQTVDLSSPTFTPMSFSSGGDTYTGVALWQVLGGTLNGLSVNSKIIPNTVTPGTSPTQPTLRSYLTVTSATGETQLLTAGEVNTFFGGGQVPTVITPSPISPAPPAPYIVATQKNGLDIAPTLIVTRDDTGARWLSDIATIAVSSVNAPLPGPMPEPGAFSVLGLPMSPVLDAGDLSSAAYDHVIEQVTFYSGTTPSTRNYQGVTVWDILESAGLGDPSPAELRNKALLATGTDGFQVMIALAELDPDLNSGQVGFISYTEQIGDGDVNSVVRLVMPGDFHGGRFVSGLRSLEVVTVSEPPVAALLALTLAALAWTSRSSARRRSRLHL